MKKAVLYGLALFLLTSPGFAETCIVLSVNGAVFADGKPVKRLMELNSEAKLTFENKKAGLRLLDNTGILIITGEKAKKNKKNNELFAVLKTSFFPVNPVKRASARGAVTNKHDFRAYMSASKNPDQPKPFLVIDEGRYHIDPKIYLLDDQKGNFFFLIYRYKGKEIPKKIKNAQHNDFIINSDIFIFINDQSEKVVVNPSEIEGDITLFYAVDEEHDEIVCGFNPVFISTEALKTELTPLIQNLKKAGTEDGEIKDRIGEYLITFYGEPGEVILKKWLTKHFGLKLN